MYFSGVYEYMEMVLLNKKKVKQRFPFFSLIKYSSYLKEKRQMQLSVDLGS